MPRLTVDARQGADQHLAAAAEYIAIAESGDAERSAYEHAAIEIEAAMKDDPSLRQKDIAKRVGISQTKVNRLLEALIRSRGSGEQFRVDWQRGTSRGTKYVAEAARERPHAFVEAFRQAPVEARQQIAREISRAPEVRAEARKRDVEAEQRQRPSDVPKRTDHVLHEFESRLVSARRSLRDALALVDGIDQPGDDEDLLELLATVKQLAEVVDESYRTGQSIDTWAWELYERSAD